MQGIAFQGSPGCSFHPRLPAFRFLLYVELEVIFENQRQSQNTIVLQYIQSPRVRPWVLLSRRMQNEPDME